MNLCKKALSAIVLLTALFVVNLVSADEVPVSQAYAHPTSDCRTSIGAQTGAVGNVLGSFGISFTLPASGDCKEYMDMVALRDQAAKFAKAGDMESFVQASKAADRHMRRMQKVETARRAYMPAPSVVPHSAIYAEPVELEARTLFAFDKAEVTPSYTKQLEDFAKNVQNTDHDVIIVEGHTDERGPNAYNDDLGMRRALAVKEVLVQFGVDAEKIQALSYSENYPAVQASTKEAWQQNRRATIRTTVYGYMGARMETPAEAKATYDAHTAKVYLADYEADLEAFKAQDPFYDIHSDELYDARKHVGSAKVRIAFANFRQTHNKLIKTLTLKEAVYWANKLDYGGEDILANRIAVQFNLQFEEGEYIVPS